MTNFEKIKAMTVEEMAIEIVKKDGKINDCCFQCAFHNTEMCSFRKMCGLGVFEWLKQEADNDT